MLRLVRTTFTDPRFKKLVGDLDAELALRDGQAHLFYDQYNSIAGIDHAVVAFEDDEAVGCGALRTHGQGCMEVKRMYVVPGSRGKGIATGILAELEGWAGAMNIEKCILETGKNQPEAIALYLKNSYRRIPNYPPYVGIDNSVCFEKYLNQGYLDTK
jgi:putative acetyltransferase